MSSRNRELADLRSKAGLQDVVTKLEEQNAELEELLKSKCAEIEENDDLIIEYVSSSSSRFPMPSHAYERQDAEGEEEAIEQDRQSLPQSANSTGQTRAWPSA
jgi:hypothetical protein